jgi:hypothetical protein
MCVGCLLLRIFARKSPTYHLEAVLQKVEYRHQGPVDGFKIRYSHGFLTPASNRLDLLLVEPTFAVLLDSGESQRHD